jgi:di/tricarboxylate transporter
MATPVVTVGALVVFGLVLGAVLLFATNIVSPDVAAISVLVALVVLEPWTGVDTETALLGFSNPATLTVVAMYMLSEGVYRTGIVRRLTLAVSRFARGSESRLLTTTLVLGGGMAGVVNNTPVVAVFIPLVTELAEEYRLSPSKLLLPLSYAAMLGGMLTVVGTSTSLLASTLSARLIGRPFSMFEFTHLGLLGLGVGIVYLVTVGQALLPARIAPSIDLIGAFGLRHHVTRLYVRPDSSFAGRPLDRLDELLPADTDIDVVEVIRDETRYAVPTPDFEVAAGDVLTVRAASPVARRLASEAGLWPLPWVPISELELTVPADIGTLVEARIPAGSDLADQRVGELQFRQRYEATILAIRRDETVIRDSFGAVVLDADDTLLLRTASDNVGLLRDTENIVVTAVAARGLVEQAAAPGIEYREQQAWIALAVIVGVVGASALGLVSIVIAALAGVVVMILTGVLEPTEAYDAVSWNVIFLLAGMIPLGVALERSGGAALLAALVVEVAGLLPPVAVVLLLYLTTAVVTNLISNNAAVVLMLPIAVDVATQLGASAFAFVLAVTFAASTSFLTPIGYQTNLMVYGPGGYEFTDYLRVGAPLQLLLALVTTAGIWLFWGVQA